MKVYKKVFLTIAITYTVVACGVGGIYLGVSNWYNAQYNHLLEEAYKNSYSEYTQDNKSSVQNPEKENTVSSDGIGTSASVQSNEENSNHTAPENQQQGTEPKTNNNNVTETSGSTGEAPASSEGSNATTEGKTTPANTPLPNGGAGSDPQNEPVKEEPKEKQPSLSEVIPKVPLPVDANKVEKKAESIVGTDVATNDYLMAGIILMKKLSPEEIKYLYSAASDGMYMQAPVEEIKRIQGIVFSKLSEDELQILKQIGRKYGKKMYILDKDIDVEKYRAGYYEGKLD